MNRENWVDNAKGICILLVILGHIIPSSSIVNKYIYSFHMPVFFFLSGYLYNHKIKFISFLNKKINSIIIPYIKVCVAYIIFNSFIMSINYDVKESVKNILFGTYTTLQYIDGHLWFLVCLFIAQIMLYLMCKISNNSRSMFRNILIISFIGYILPKYIISNIPFNLLPAFMATAFLGMGYLYKNIKGDKQYSICIYILFFIIQIICSLYNYKRVDMASSTYGSYTLFSICSITSIILIIKISKMINNSFIEYCGQQSMFFFLWHQLIFNIYNKVSYNYFVNLNYNLQIIIQFIVTVLTLLIISKFNIKCKRLALRIKS